MALLKNLSNDLKKLLENAKMEEKEVLENYDREVHWTKIGLSCEAVSKECTKLSVAYSKPPFPTNDLPALLEGIHLSMDVLISWYKTFPLDEGRLLHNHLESCISGIVEAVCALLHAVDVDTTLEGLHRKTAIGKVWSCCEKFKSLPKTNCEALFLEVEKIHELVNDAINEINEELKEPNDDGLDSDEEKETWSNEERSMVKPSIGVLMACKALLKKTKTSLHENYLSSPALNSQIDIVKELMDAISPTVDDVVMLMYPPVDSNALLAEATSLKDKLLETIQILRFILDSPSYLERLEFIEKALKHNIGKLSTLIS